MTQQMQKAVEAAVESFMEDVLADERTSVGFAEAVAVAVEVGIHVTWVVAAIRRYGIEVVRTKPREVRGFTSNNHNRWEGNPCGGGSGWEQIAGFAGRRG